MDTNPHTHNPRLRKAWGMMFPGPWVIDYGDQKVQVCHSWFGHKPNPEQIQTALNKAVLRHDEESRKADDSAEAFAEKINEGELFNQFSAMTEYGLFRREKKEWGSDIINASSKTD